MGNFCAPRGRWGNFCGPCWGSFHTDNTCTTIRPQSSHPSCSSCPSQWRSCCPVQRVKHCVPRQRRPLGRDRAQRSGLLTCASAAHEFADGWRYGDTGTGVDRNVYGARVHCTQHVGAGQVRAEAGGRAMEPVLLPRAARRVEDGEAVAAGQGTVTRCRNVCHGIFMSDQLRRGDFPVFSVSLRPAALL